MPEYPNRCIELMGVELDNAMKALKVIGARASSDSLQGRWAVKYDHVCLHSLAVRYGEEHSRRLISYLAVASLQPEVTGITHHNHQRHFGIGCLG